jgi:hypothetical protein
MMRFFLSRLMYMVVVFSSTFSITVRYLAECWCSVLGWLW